ncbi:heterokaryon incompatibility protein-domain-containing protein, partial [Boeremia exigua]|uniref:heterokaryon incompatibility protein-domain-containing protein n=1 Tax=Boeremia exigua TaxID=749465 RepID=UPI001E8CA822
MEQSEQDDEFSHPLLDGRPNSIRLVRIRHDRSQDGRICCDMRTAKVYEEYTCLSYVWGDAKHDAGIEINGRVFKDVQKNLWDFLDATITRKNNPRWLWIDALCINQSDEKEKNDQVQRMGDIFRNAREVVSWLGNDRHITALLEKRHPSRRGVEKLLSSPYWGRAWITQEVALAPSLTLMAGHAALGFADVAQMVDSWEGFKSRPRIEGSRVDPTRWRLFRGESLMLLLQECREKQCRDYHDKIYSLAGLCCESNSIEVDYSVSRGRLAVEVLRACHQWFCLCSVALVGLTLRLVKRTVPRAKRWKREKRGRNFSTPFAQCSVPATTMSDGTK